MEDFEEDTTDEDSYKFPPILDEGKTIFGDTNEDNSFFLQQEFFSEESLRSENARLKQDNSRLLKEFNQMREQLQSYRKQMQDLHEIFAEGMLPPIENKSSRSAQDLEEKMKTELLKKDQVIKAQRCQIQILRDQLSKRITNSN